ncbi:hypothetical protein [Pseudoalteromonas sp. GutCa3]|uniref:hypothetical protein n=1 Tax=Pseudoalteromonas sp. GutCa3 TaxID=888433 RepID=UPI000C32F100|nr:hypothetical protein [Pseudoalteromonas sp. GutCa3]PKG68656.1 hypothetical protein CXF64_20250 [Pseudoalteromonas sp. GutCa3]
MNCATLITENQNFFYAKSKGKVYRIDKLSFNDDCHDELLKGDGLVAVGSLPNFENIDLMTHRHKGERDFSFEKEPGTIGFFIRVYTGDFFQIAGVFDSVIDANNFMKDDDDVALIDSTNIRGLSKQFHFIAYLTKSNIKKI